MFFYCYFCGQKYSHFSCTFLFCCELIDWRCVCVHSDQIISEKECPLVGTTTICGKEEKEKLMTPILVCSEACLFVPTNECLFVCQSVFVCLCAFNYHWTKNYTSSATLIYITLFANYVVSFLPIVYFFFPPFNASAKCDLFKFGFSGTLAFDSCVIFNILSTLTLNFPGWQMFWIIILAFSRYNLGWEFGFGNWYLRILIYVSWT